LSQINRCLKNFSEIYPSQWLGKAGHSAALDRIGDAHMKKKTLLVGTIAVTALVAGGWALAQSVGPPGGLGPPFMRGQGHGGMGPDMMKGMHGQSHDSRGPPMMKVMGSHGPGMMKGKARGMHGAEGASPDAGSVPE
jgi:hypothetical protein